MFTGLIEKIGKVQSVEDRRGQRKAVIQTGFTDLQNGESISINGICLTVTESNPKGDAHFFISEETLACSNLKDLQEGQKVNLERAVKASDRMGGHFVQGHVDTTGLLLNSSPGHDHHKLSIALDPKYGRYCVEKGSIAVNGVSLTINHLQQTKQNEFIVSLLIIPHTWKHTNLSEIQPGGTVNIEVDVLAKYIEKLCPNFIQPLSN